MRRGEVVGDHPQVHHGGQGDICVGNSIGDIEGGARSGVLSGFVFTAEEAVEFADDLQRQIRDKIVNSRFNMQISWEDLAAACSGELCVASIQPDNDPEKHAAILIVDITGRQEQAQAVLKDISIKPLKGPLVSKH